MSYLSGITGIGYNPYMNGLGMFGLPVGGTYSSYYNPAFMGYGGMGMMGMYPGFMSQMNQAYQNIEMSKLNHSSAMHNLMKEHEVSAYKADDQALFEKAMEDNGLQSDIDMLAKTIREGDSDAICQAYDKIKANLYHKYNTTFTENNDRIIPENSVRQIIEGMYANIISAKAGQPVTLYSDIKKYGESAFMHGFNSKFFGKKDYHNKYTEEVISYIYNRRIDNKGGKDRMEKIGGILGKGAEVGAAGLAGFGAGLGLTAFAATFSSKVRNKLGTAFVRDEAGNIIKQAGKKLTSCTFGNGIKRAGKIGMLAGLALAAADFCWQLTRD